MIDTRALTMRALAILVVLLLISVPRARSEPGLEESRREVDEPQFQGSKSQMYLSKMIVQLLGEKSSLWRGFALFPIYFGEPVGLYLSSP
jgi:hypothetical protein